MVSDVITPNHLRRAVRLKRFVLNISGTGWWPQGWYEYCFHMGLQPLLAQKAQKRSPMKEFQDPRASLPKPVETTTNPNTSKAITSVC